MHLIGQKKMLLYDKGGLIGQKWRNIKNDTHNFFIYLGATRTIFFKIFFLPRKINQNTKEIA